jgi:hypothetical protein
MSNQSVKPESLRPVLEGFRRISKTDQIEYLKYLGLVIERKTGNEKRKFIRFKTKLKKELKFTGKSVDLRKFA